MRALLVVNPKATATTARARDVLAHALASESRLDVVETKARGHASELAAASVGEYDVVVALGGDGTVNEVVNGLLGTGIHAGVPALAVVPGGSTNVFARALGLPNSPVEATSMLLDALRLERRRTVGLGRVEGRWFTFNAGLGLDAAVVRRVESRRAAGHQATPALYMRNALREFFLASHRRHPAITLEHPGAPPQQLGLALVSNTAPWTYVGTRALNPSPRASFDTGLDVFGLRRLGTVSIFRHAAQSLAGDARPHGRQVVSMHDLTEVILTASRPLPLQLDGEALGDRSRVTFSSVPAALRVVV